MRWRWLLALPMIGGCYGDPDRFNQREAELLCDVAEQCGDTWEFGLDTLPGDSCEDSRVEQLSECAMSCDYDATAARDCIRGLRKSLHEFLGPDCGLDDHGALDACAQVYTNCDEGDVAQCAVEEPSFTCAVTGHGPPSLAWLALVWVIRRRGPRCA